MSLKIHTGIRPETPQSGFTITNACTSRMVSTTGIIRQSTKNVDLWDMDVIINLSSNIDLHICS